MKILSSLLVSVLLMSVAGCGRGDGEGAPPPTPEEVKPVLEKTFSDAPPEVKASVDNISGYIQNDDPAGAFIHLQQLRSRSDLTSEQRDAASEATRAVSIKLQEAADKGDEQAKEVITRYRSSK